MLAPQLIVLLMLLFTFFIALNGDAMPSDAAICSFIIQSTNHACQGLTTCKGLGDVNFFGYLQFLPLSLTDLRHCRCSFSRYLAQPIVVHSDCYSEPALDYLGVSTPYKPPIHWRSEYGTRLC